MTRWLVLVTLLGCKGGGKTDVTEPKPGGEAPISSKARVPDPAPTAPAETCDAKAARLGARLATLAKEKPGALPMVFPAGLTLPDSPSGKAIDDPGVVVVLTRDDKVIAAGNTVPLAEGARLVDEAYWRTSLEAAAMGRAPKKPWSLYLWADKQAKVASLASLLSGEVFQDFTLRLLVASESAVPDAALLQRPSVKKLVDSLPNTAYEAEVARAAAMRNGGDPCTTLPMAYANSSIESGPTNQLAVMAGLIPKALLACKCQNSDFDAFEFGMLSIFGAFAPTPRWVALPKLAPNDKRTIGELAAKL